MKVFHCDHCGHLLFFENTQCVKCGRTVAYLPDLALVGSLDASAEPAAGGGETWRSPLEGAAGRVYRLCANYSSQSVCNWAVDASDPNPLCLSCRLTRVIPDLTTGEHRPAWYRLEAAKRRLIFTLLKLRLPIVSRDEDPDGGLAFEFKSDALTGHATGVITVNLAEADDAERERRRTSLHEPYRTLVGHFRHEIGHYYWDRLIAGTDALDAFRERFGDERPDYGEALKTYYANGPAADWQERFISAYASAHPLEDWAETWAHYLHMVDTLETAASCGISLQPRRADEPSLKRVPAVVLSEDVFDRLIDSWYPVTYVLNNLNRGMGVVDAYPFVWSSPAVEKLRFVHEIVSAAGTGPATRKSEPEPQAQSS
jgi:hypothetical protein